MNKLLATVLLMVSLWSGGCSSKEFPTEIVFDAGNVFLEDDKPQTWKVIHRFNVKNTTSQKILFSDVFVSCGCAKCDLSKTELEPNETVEIKLEANLRYLRESRSEFANINWLHEGSQKRLLRVAIVCEASPRVVVDHPTTSLEIDLSLPQPEKIILNFFSYCPINTQKQLDIEFPGLTPKMLGVGVSKTGTSTTLSGGIERIRKQVLISPQAYLNTTISDFDIVAKSDEARFVFPVKLIRKEVMKITPPSVFLSAKKRTAKIRVDTNQAPCVLKRVDYDRSQFTISEPVVVDEGGACEFEIALTGDPPIMTVEKNVIFEFDEMGPLKLSVYLFQTTAN